MIADDGGDASAGACTSYEKLAQRKEENAAREVLLEKRAVAITRQRLDLLEREEKERAERDVEKQRREHLIYQRRFVNGNAVMESKREMEENLRAQIYKTMRAKEEEREEQADRSREAAERRDKMVLGSKLWYQFDLERRRKEHQENIHQKSEDVEKKFELAAQNLKTLQAARQQHLEERANRQQAKLAKAQERRRKELQQEHQDTLAKIQAKEECHKEAEQRRQEQLRQSAESKDEKLRRHEQRVASQKELFEQQAEEKRQRALERDAALMRERSEFELQAASRMRGRDIRPVRGQPSEPSSARGEARRQSPDRKGETIGQEQQDGSKPSHTTKRAVELDMTKKKYVERIHNLEETRHRALAMKKFKELANLGKPVEDKHEDVTTQRLRVIHNMYIGGQGTFGTSPHSQKRAVIADNGELKSPKEHGSPVTTPRSRPRCGLCMKQFAPDLLVGSEKRKLVERLKHKVDGTIPCTPRKKQVACSTTSQEISTISAPLFSVETVCSTDVPPTTLGSCTSLLSGTGSVLEQTVRLCAPCWHFLRITSA